MSSVYYSREACDSYASDARYKARDFRLRPSRFGYESSRFRAVYLRIVNCSLCTSFTLEIKFNLAENGRSSDLSGEKLPSKSKRLISTVCVIQSKTKESKSRFPYSIETKQGSDAIHYIVYNQFLLFV